MRDAEQLSALVIDLLQPPDLRPKDIWVDNCGHGFGAGVFRQRANQDAISLSELIFLVHTLLPPAAIDARN